MAERSKALVLGTSLFGGVGSNPTPIKVPVSLVGQDTWFSPMRPGFESRTGKVSFFFLFCVCVVHSDQKIKKQKVISHRGTRTHDHKIKSLALYQLS